ncbi:WUSCHEL-related homeobox 9 [Linum grandiflorum]
MASSNRHWPSMFKSKPSACNHHQWQHDVTHHPSPPPPTHRPNSSYNPVGAVGEERSPEPKPRWNPKPEQIRILEAIFNSGIVNPPRDEIRRIRVQLQEFGQVGDANVFYWFQNRKSRSKHKLRSQSSKTAPHQPPPVTTTTAPSSSSSSSSDNYKPSPRAAGSKRTLSSRSEQNGVVFLDPSSTTTATHQPSSYDFFSSEPVPFYNQQPTGFCFSEPVPGNVVGPCTSLLLSDILNLNHHRKLMDHVDHDDGSKKLQLDHHQICYSHETSNNNNNDNVVTTTSPMIGVACNPVTTPSTFLSHIPGGGMGSTEDHHHHHQSETNPKSTATVFINDLPFEVGTGPFNVREAFGDDMLLVHSSGQPVLTDDWGITLQSLNHGGFYYLVPFPTSSHHI